MSDAHHPTIGFIGAGNMAHCLINGLVADDYPATQIWASDPSEEQLNFLNRQFHIHTTKENEAIVTHSDILVLAVKPQVMKSVIEPLASSIQKKKSLVVSIAAGISVTAFSQWLGPQTAIVRCMPNVAAFVGSAATGMYANKNVSPLQRDLAETILRSVGITLWVQDEKLIDTIAALSGSGPAYFFSVMETLEKTAIKLGLNEEDAHLLTLQTALGAARLAMSTNETTSELRQRVTSKGGITEKALAVLETHRTQDAFAKALEAAYDRSIEMSKQLI
ncbi:MAG TPA: pyrroline-5-carboxylate reductase [Gammaproteobacteria bacterium]|nr:pyrroline-5-carboxylate reductase [Gammaproteobacteria bacterium]